MSRRSKREPVWLFKLVVIVARSQKTFARWVAQDSSTWSFRVFQRYNREMEDMWHAHMLAVSTCYHTLGKQGIQWTEPSSARLYGEVSGLTRFPTIKNWSESINQFGYFTNLSIILTLASNLETYMASVIRMALESDPGLLLGLSKSIDGAFLLKHRRNNFVAEIGQVESCVKGEWSSRLTALEKLFGDGVAPLRHYHSDLEQIRKLRNKIGHAFGRDIEEARKHGVLENLAMEKISQSTTDRLRRSVYDFIKALDIFILKNHVGEYEVVRYYADIFPQLNQEVNQGQRAYYLKKRLGQYGATPRGKVFCKALVEYWEAL